MTLHMNKWTNVVMDDGWVHPLANALPPLVNNLWWNMVMDDWNLDEKSFGKWQFLQHETHIIPQNVYKEWHIMLGQHYRGRQLVSTILIGDTKYHILCSLSTQTEMSNPSSNVKSCVVLELLLWNWKSATKFPEKGNAAWIFHGEFE